MVQQQYIIAELGDYDLMADGNIMSKGIHINENKSGSKDNLEFQKDFKDKIVDNARKKALMTK